MEGGSTIELQFRSGEDLFKNYSIGIIRQVVDKSEYATPFHAAFKEDYVYSSEDATSGESHAIITQEMLWEEYNNADMLKLAKDLAYFQHCRTLLPSA